MHMHTLFSFSVREASHTNTVFELLKCLYQQTSGSHGFSKRTVLTTHLNWWQGCERLATDLSRKIKCFQGHLVCAGGEGGSQEDGFSRPERKTARRESASARSQVEPKGLRMWLRSAWSWSQSKKVWDYIYSWIVQNDLHFSQYTKCTILVKITINSFFVRSDRGFCFLSPFTEHHVHRLLIRSCF